MKEWLLKDEKNKVGRPRLANDEVLKKAKISIAIGLIISFILMFSFFSILKGTTPTKYAYSLTLEKLFGELTNKNGFIVNDYYDDNDDYVMEFKIPNILKRIVDKYNIRDEIKNIFIKSLLFLLIHIKANKNDIKKFASLYTTTKYVDNAKNSIILLNSFIVNFL